MTHPLSAPAHPPHTFWPVPHQYGFIPGSSTAFALIARLHRQFRRCGLWELLCGLRKAFDLVDHWKLVAKLHSLGVKPVTLNWNRLRWSFLAMINTLKAPRGSKLMWKLPDDNTISELIPPSRNSNFQQAVDCISNWSQENRSQPNPSKFKEMLTWELLLMMLLKRLMGTISKLPVSQSTWPYDSE